jgi:hypothetical protein
VKVVLHLWKRLWQSVTFDTERGAGRVHWLRRPPPIPSGWAFKHKGTWYAVWNNGASLVFQAGAKQLPMSEAFQCRNVRRGGIRRFSIAGEDGRLIWELIYGAVDRDDDPTFDAADLEQNDFFVWTAKLWSDPKWRHDVVQNWCTSHAPEESSASER